MPRTLVEGVQIGEQQRNITDTDVQRIIGGDSELLVTLAEGFGQRISRRVSASHIRNIYGMVKQMEMREFDATGVHELLMLKPKLAYAAKRDGSREARELKDVLSCAVDAVGSDPQKFARFVDFFEAILAYHKAYGGK